MNIGGLLGLRLDVVDARNSGFNTRRLGKSPRDIDDLFVTRSAGVLWFREDEELPAPVSGGAVVAVLRAVRFPGGEQSSSLVPAIHEVVEGSCISGDAEKDLAMAVKRVGVE